MFDRLQVFLGRVFTLEAEDLKREEGQTVTEYAVVLGVLIIALGGIVFLLRDAISAFITRVGNALAALPLG
jgi:Flp pilus assembly pilin Flp